MPTSSAPTPTPTPYSHLHEDVEPVDAALVGPRHGVGEASRDEHRRANGQLARRHQPDVLEEAGAGFQRRARDEVLVKARDAKLGNDGREHDEQGEGEALLLEQHRTRCGWGLWLGCGVVRMEEVYEGAPLARLGCAS